MNLPNFKDILKNVLEKLSVLKNNLSVMISIIIALVALLLFIPTQLLSSGLKKEIDNDSLKTLKSLDNLHIVSDDELKKTQKLKDNIATEANSIEELAIQTTERELLSYDIFNLDPNDPNASVSQAVFYNFGRKYCGRIDQFIQDELQEAGIDSILQSGSGRFYSNNTGSIEENIQGMMIDQICLKRAEEAFIYLDPIQISGYGFWSQYPLICIGSR